MPSVSRTPEDSRFDRFRAISDIVVFVRTGIARTGPSTKIGERESGRVPTQRRVARVAGRGRRRRGFHHTRRPCIPLARPWVRPLRRRPARPCPAPAFPNFDPRRARGTGRGIAGQPGRGRARRCVRLIAQVRSCRLNQDLSCQCGAGQILRQLQASVLQSGSARRRRQGAGARRRGPRSAVRALPEPLGALCGPIAARMRLARPPRARLGLVQQVPGGPARAARRAWWGARGSALAVTL